MITETRRKRLAIKHCERINAGDLDGLLALYAPSVRFEDPIGSGEKVGHTALREHFGSVIAARAVEEAGPVVAAQDGVHAAVSVTATRAYLPQGPELAAAGLLRPPRDEHTARLRTRYLMIIGVGSGGLIETLQAYWGPGDVTVYEGDTAVTGPEPNSDLGRIARRSLVAQRYVDGMNDGDLDGVLSLFVPDPRLEDPVGSPPQLGFAAVREHLERAIRGEVREEADVPTGSLDGRYATMGAKVTVGSPDDPAGTRMQVRVAGVLRLNEAGRIENLRVMWGRSDAGFITRPK